MNKKQVQHLKEMAQLEALKQTTYGIDQKRVKIEQLASGDVKKTFTLLKGESIPNPASTKTKIHGPQTVTMFVRPSSIDTAVEDFNLVW